MGIYVLYNTLIAGFETSVLQKSPGEGEGSNSPR